MTDTLAALRELRRPFQPEAIRWKFQVQVRCEGRGPDRWP